MKIFWKWIATLLAIMIVVGATPMCFAADYADPMPFVSEVSSISLDTEWTKDYTLNDGVHHATISSLGLYSISDVEVYDISPVSDEPNVAGTTWMKLSATQQKAIISILANKALYFENENSEAQNRAVRNATQILVWEIVTGLRDANTFIRNDNSLFSLFFAAMPVNERNTFTYAYTQLERLLYITDMLNLISVDEDIYFNTEHNIPTGEYKLIYEDKQNALADYNMSEIKKLAESLGMSFSYTDSKITMTATEETMNILLGLQETTIPVIHVPAQKRNSVCRYNIEHECNDFISINTPIHYINICFSIYEAIDAGPIVFPFTDVSEKAWYYNAVLSVYIKGIFGGTSETTFEPETPMTRAMLVTVLYRLDGKPHVDFEKMFTDVPNDTWYSDAVSWAAKNGIVNGIGNNKFDPDANVTREQVATILFRYAQYNGVNLQTQGTIGKMEDVNQISSWAKEAVTWSIRTGIIGGSQENGKLYIFPQSSASRAEVATMLLRLHID